MLMDTATDVLLGLLCHALGDDRIDDTGNDIIGRFRPDRRQYAGRAERKGTRRFHHSCEPAGLAFTICYGRPSPPKDHVVMVELFLGPFDWRRNAAFNGHSIPRETGTRLTADGRAAEERSHQGAWHFCAR